MALDALILDIDGTLFDTNYLHAKAWTAAMERFGYGLPVDRVVVEIGKSGSRLVPAMLGDRAEEEEGDALRDAHDAVFLDLVDREGVRVFEGAEAVFTRAREAGLKTAVATGSAQESLEKMIGKAGLDVRELADVVVSDDDVEDGKPGPDPVMAAAEKLGLTAAQCALVGDTPYDVASARRAGAVCFGVLTGVHPAERMLSEGARGVYSDIGALVEQFDEAVRLASPGSVRFSLEAMQGFMREALDEAREGLANGDLPVGAVLLDGSGSVVARARSITETSGDFIAHAEMEAFRQISGRYPLQRRDLILVSTLEPCMMCFGAAMSARVDTIIYALEAPSNGGITRCSPMQSPGMVMPRVVRGVGADEAQDLFADWNRRHPDTPFVQDLLQRLSKRPAAEGQRAV